MAEGLPDEFAELAVIIRGAVSDFKDAMDEVDDALDRTRRKAQRAGKAINSALDFDGARRELEQTKQQLEQLGDEAQQTRAKLERLDGTDVDVDIDFDKDTFSSAVSAAGDGGGGGSSGGGGRSGKNFEQDFSRLSDELFAVVNIISKLSVGLKVLVGGALALVASFVGLNLAVGGLAAGATALATQLGDPQLRRAITSVKATFFELGRDFVSQFRGIILNQVVPFLKQFAGEIRAIIPELAQITRRNLPELQSFLSGLVSVLPGVLQAFEIIVDVADLFRDAINALEATVFKLVDSLVGSLGEDSLLGMGIMSTDLAGERQKTFEAFRDLMRSFGQGGETVLGIKIPEEPQTDSQGADAPTGPTNEALKRAKEYARTLSQIDSLRGEGAPANIISFPEAQSRRLDAAKSTLEDILTQAANTNQSVEGVFQSQEVASMIPGIKTIEDLFQRVRTLQISVPLEKAKREVERLRNGFQGTIATGRQVEKRFVKMVQTLRQLPKQAINSDKALKSALENFGLAGPKAAEVARQMQRMPDAALNSKEEVRALLQQFDLAPGKIDRIIKRLRGMTPVLQKVQEAFKGFLRSLGQGFAEAFTDLLFSAFEKGKSELQKAREKLDKIQLKQQLADARSRLASGDLTSLEFRATQQRIKILRKELQKANDTVSAIGGAFRSMAQVAKQALQELIQQLLVAIGKALILKAINAASGVSGASSIVGGIGQLLGSVFGGGGGGGSGGSGGGNPPMTRSVGPGGAQSATAQLRGNSVVIPVETIGDAVGLGNNNQRRTGRS